jgi:hypothetical protein
MEIEVKHTFAALTATLMITAAAPASAYGISFELPRLSFPTKTTPDVSQDCSNPAALTTLGCTDAE